MTDLDTRIRNALHADAESAPELPAAWVGPVTATVVPIGRRRSARRVATLVAGVAAAAALVVALATVARPGGADPAPAASTSAPAIWAPPGTEFALTDLGASAASPGGPVVEALTRRIGVAGHPDQIVSPSLTYMGAATAEVHQCVWENGGGGCNPEWNPATWSIGRTSSVDNGDADFDLVTVDGVTADAAFVGYTSGDVAYWQRPVAGFAALPYAGDADVSVTAWDRNGVVVATYDDDAYFDLVSEPHPTLGYVAKGRPLVADLSQEQHESLSELTRSSMRTCLTDRGGTIGDGDVATFAPSVDQVAIWDECVAAVKEIVGEAVAALDPEFYDPALDR
jgi:hypothetical protein